MAVLLGFLINLAQVETAYNENNRPEVSKKWLIVCVALQGLRMSVSGVVHFLLAEKYETIATKVPQTFAAVEEPKKEGCQIAMKVLFWLNIFLPLSLATCIYFVRSELDENGGPKNDILILNAVMAGLTGLVQIVTGVILVGSVFKIRAFFK